MSINLVYNCLDQNNASVKDLVSITSFCQI